MMMYVSMTIILFINNMFLKMNDYGPFVEIYIAHNKRPDDPTDGYDRPRRAATRQPTLYLDSAITRLPNEPIVNDESNIFLRKML